MQQEDDLRALAKIMDFGRAVSIFLLVIHAYVYCYPSFHHWNLTLEVVDRILLNFNRTTGIFNCILGASWRWSCCWPFPAWAR